MGEQLGKRENITAKVTFYTHTILFKELQTLKPLENVLNFTFLLTHSTHSFNIYVLILKRLVVMVYVFIMSIL